MTLYEYVQRNAIRGDCTCGMCADASADPKQPDGHTIDMTFFKVAKSENANPNTFLDLVQEEFPSWLDGEEHSYIHMGAEIGDQGIAIMAIALGHLLGIWKAFTPAMLGFPKELQTMMAGQGLLSMKAEEKTDDGK